MLSRIYISSGPVTSLDFEFLNISFSPRSYSCSPFSFYISSFAEVSISVIDLFILLRSSLSSKICYLYMLNFAIASCSLSSIYSEYHGGVRLVIGISGSLCSEFLGLTALLSFWFGFDIVISD